MQLKTHTQFSADDYCPRDHSLDRRLRGSLHRAGFDVVDEMMGKRSDMAPTWLLLPADMMHNRRMAKHLDRCDMIVSVGRVKWFGNQSGMENSAWYLFDTNFTDDTLFFARAT